jgi:hypothetical protein
MRNIVRFPRQPQSTSRRNCAGCGTTFLPRHSSHAFCSTCYRLGTAGRYLLAAVELYKRRDRS